jgi:hypothetical protein
MSPGKIHNMKAGKTKPLGLITEAALLFDAYLRDNLLLFHIIVVPMS